MSEFWLSREFWFGAVILLFFQSAKFNELSTNGDRGPSYSVAIPGLRAKDFASKLTYYLFLIIFLLASLAAYSIVCAVPTVALGWLKLTGADASTQQSVQSVAFPLYVVAIFIGITHAVPGIPNISNIQRDVFHGIIGIPKYVIDVAERFLNDILEKCVSNNDYEEIIVKLKGQQWISTIDGFADTIFYKSQIDSLKLDSDDQSLTQNRSRREQRYIIGQLVYSACVAAVRKSGRRGLFELAKKLGLEPPHSDLEEATSILYLIVSGIVCATFLLILIPAFHDIAKAMLSGQKDWWPNDLPTSAQYLASHLLPILVAAIVALVIARARQNSHGHIGDVILYLAIILSVVIFDAAQSLYDFGVYYVEPKGIWATISNRLPIYVVHSVISVFVCVVMLRYMKTAGQFRGIAAKSVYLTIMLVGVGLLSGFYAYFKMYYHYDRQIGLDYLVVVLFLNVAAALFAILAAFTICDRAHRIDAAPVAAAV